MAASVSVIVPALNEERVIEPTLRSVARQRVDHEIIIVDGGSTDGTTAIAEGYGRVLHAPRGRSRQMNAGAEAASGAVYVFLHADTLLPANALDEVCEVLQNESVEGGAFRLRFDRWSPLLRLYSFCTRFAFPRICFGDRALFVRREVFEDIGGYPVMPLFEDLELVRILSDRGGFTFLPHYVTTSARRFAEVGPLRQQLRNTYLWLHYVAGTDPERLTHLYPYPTAEDASN